MAESEPSTSTLLADLLSSRPLSQGDELSFELLRLSGDPLLLNAFINRADPIGATSRNLIKASRTIPFLAIEPEVGTRKVGDRFKVEPLHPNSVRPEAFSPLEDGERPDICGHGACRVQGVTALILIFAMMTMVCLLLPMLWQL